MSAKKHIATYFRLASSNRFQVRNDRESIQMFLPWRCNVVRSRETFSNQVYIQQAGTHFFLLFFVVFFCYQLSCTHHRGFSAFKSCKYEQWNIEIYISIKQTRESGKINVHFHFICFCMRKKLLIMIWRWPSSNSLISTVYCVMCVLCASVVLSWMFLHCIEYSCPTWCSLTTKFSYKLADLMWGICVGVCEPRCLTRNQFNV